MAGPSSNNPGFGGQRCEALAVEDVRAVVLVEGMSDQRALETLAARRRRDLAAEGIAVVPMGGATTIGHFLARYGPRASDVKLAGLCDAGEARYVGRCLERAGVGPAGDPTEMEALGFYVCHADLEDELIRALGPQRVEEVIAAQGELGSLRILQQQPAQRSRTVQQQLRRFMGSRGGRKQHYAPLLVDALDLDNVPRPLDGVLDHAHRSVCGRAG